MVDSMRVEQVVSELLSNPLQRSVSCGSTRVFVFTPEELVQLVLKALEKANDSNR